MRQLIAAPEVNPCFDYLVTLLYGLSTHMLSLQTSHEYLSQVRIPPLQRQFSWSAVARPNFTYALTSTEGRELVFMPFWVMSPVFLNGWPQFLELYEASHGEIESHSTTILDTDNHRKLLVAMTGTAFVSYYESIYPLITGTYGRESATWPRSVDFARCLRNGFAHGGRWYFANPGAPSVAWRRWQKSAADNNTPVLFGPDNFAIADVIFLMLEVDAELQRAQAGAPTI